ncbi:phosphotransferase family protein, partial [Mycobacterium sp. E1747]|uniref:phosphotransferase family protein n=1 Tax=Mycobacterium sp. E1747 TaxID=1834128 RepID=UPI000A4F20DA
DVHICTASGLSAETVMFTATWRADGVRVRRDLVARVAPAGRGMFYSYDLDLEAEVMNRLRRLAHLPIPEVLCYVGDVDAVGAPFFIMERLTGTTPADDPPFTTTGWFYGLSPQRKRIALDNGLAAMASLHRVDPAAVGLNDIGRYGPVDGDTLGAQIDHWEKAFHWATDGTANPGVAAGFEWVRANRPRVSEPRVISWGGRAHR